MLRHLTTSVLLAAGIAAFAQSGTTINFTYDTSGDEAQKWGTTRQENYDVAIRIADKGMVGSKVKGVIVPMLGTDDLAVPKAFMTSKLELKVIDGKKQNVADIATVDAEFNDKGELVATFPEPYTITDAGVYVGFSFAVNALNDVTKFPLVVGSGVNPDGLFLHTSRSCLKWTSKSAEIGRVSSMRVVLEGSYAEYAVGVNGIQDGYFSTTEKCGLSVRLVNYGATAVNTITYEYTLGSGEKKTVKDFALSPALGASYGESADYMIPFENPGTFGTYPLDFKVTEVNGHPNQSALAQGKANLTVMAFVPVHRPLFEEYTGTWCGWCPLGFATMEAMNELYPDDFVCLSYHYNDPMMVSVELGSSPGGYGYPNAYLDRQHVNHVYLGNTTYPFGIEQTWNEARATSAMCSVDVQAAWADDMTKIKCKALTRFVRDYSDADIRVGFALVANELTCPNPEKPEIASAWEQHNYLKNGSGAEYLTAKTEKYLKIFNDAKGSVSGLKYNDVCVEFSTRKGIPNSIPANIETGKEYETTYEFDLAQVKNYLNSPIIQDPEKLQVVAVVMTNNGTTILNSNKTPRMGKTGVETIEGSAAEVASEVYYDLAGRRIDNPAVGIYVKVTTFTDGRRKSTKVALN